MMEAEAMTSNRVTEAELIELERLCAEATILISTTEIKRIGGIEFGRNRDIAHAVDILRINGLLIEESPFPALLAELKAKDADIERLKGDAAAQPSEDDVERVAEAIRAIANPNLVSEVAVYSFAEAAIAAMSPRPQAGIPLGIGETVLTAICARKGIDVAGYEVGKVVSVEGPRAVVHVGGEDLWFSLEEIFRSAARPQQVAAQRPQAGMISADRACEIIKDMIDDGGASIGDLNEASRTIRMEAGDDTPSDEDVDLVRRPNIVSRYRLQPIEDASERPQVEAEAIKTNAQLEGLIDDQRGELASLQSDYERAVEALKGLLLHAGIADAAPEDVDEEDRALERRARSIVSQAQTQAQKGGA